ncbi:MAG: O-antigen ligase family protein [Candidatus Cloacimonas sp.]|jgi:O-antigen ligase|nr:O-antigen ligase family protein [Candidatus Cloacimonas sp.]
MDFASSTQDSRQFSAKRAGSQTCMVLVALACCAASIALASLAQGLGVSYLFIALGAGVGWLCYSLVFGLGLHSSLPLIILFFIKPFEQSFYLLLGFFALLLVLELINRGEQKLLIPYPLALILLLGFGLLSASKITASLGYGYFVSTIIVPFLTLILCANAKIEKNSLLLWMQGIAGIGALVGFFGIILAIKYPLERLGSLWVTAMTVNGFYTVAFFFAVSLALHYKQQLTRLLWIVAACFILFGMLYTYTRMAILAVAFGLFLFMIKLKAMRYIGFALVLLLPLMIPSSMLARIQTGFGWDISLVIRALAWYFALTQIYSHPFTGLGFSVWSTWYPQVIPLRILYAQHTHNLYLNLMVDMGIIGTLAYFYIIWQILRTYWQAKIKQAADILPYGYWVAMMSLLFACLTDIFIQQYSVSILFWISLGLMLANSKTKETNG